MFAGCSGTYLDLTPEMQNVLNNYYKDAEQLRKGVNSAYGILQAEGVYELANLVLGELPSDNTWDEVPANDNGNYGQLDLFSMTSANTIIDKAWSHHYKGIQQCNVILNRVDGIADMAEAEKKNIKGEMCFLRGLMYFNLVRIFGDVQLVTKETTNPNDFFGQVRTPKEEVYKQIVQDLADAFAMLPDAPAEKGKAAKGAAAALLGKVYLTLKDYDNSLKYLQEVERFGYALLDEPADIFDVNNKGNKEIIFDVQFESGVNGNSEGSRAFQKFSPSGTVSGALGHNLPTKEVYGLFADNDKRKSAYFIVTKNGVIGTGKLKQTSATVADGGSNIIVVKDTGKPSSLKTDIAAAQSESFKNVCKLLQIGISQIRSGKQRRGQNGTKQRREEKNLYKIRFTSSLSAGNKCYKADCVDIATEEKFLFVIFSGQYSKIEKYVEFSKFVRTYREGKELAFYGRKDEFHGQRRIVFEEPSVKE